MVHSCWLREDFACRAHSVTVIPSPPEKFGMHGFEDKPDYFQLDSHLDGHELLDFTYLRLGSTSIRNLSSGAVLTRCSG